MPDKELTCFDCGNGFKFTEQEQADYAKRGFQNEPKRCPECRRQRQRGGRGKETNNGPRVSHEIVCSQCGKKAQVPFKPRQDRPVYCDDCFRANKA